MGGGRKVGEEDEKNNKWVTEVAFIKYQGDKQKKKHEVYKRTETMASRCLKEIRVSQGVSKTG